jgi:hypothetical protein
LNQSKRLIKKRTMGKNRSLPYTNVARSDRLVANGKKYIETDIINWFNIVPNFKKKKICKKKFHDVDIDKTYPFP